MNTFLFTIDGSKSLINTNRKLTTRFPMNLTWTPYVAPKPPRGAQKTQTGLSPCKIALRLKKVCYSWGDDGKSKCVVTYANSLTNVRRLAVAKRPRDCSYLITAPSASAVTPSENNSTQIGSSLWAFQWAYGEQYTLPLSPHRVAENAKWPKFEQ